MIASDISSSILLRITQGLATASAGVQADVLPTVHDGFSAAITAAGQDTTLLPIVEPLRREIPTRVEATGALCESFRRIQGVYRRIASSNDASVFQSPEYRHGWKLLEWASRSFCPIDPRPPSPEEAMTAGVLESMATPSTTGCEKLLRRNRELEEYLKALRCIYGLTHLAAQTHLPLDQVFQKTLEALSTVWPATGVGFEIVFADARYSSGPFDETSPDKRHVADIVVDDCKVGSISVGMLEKITPTISYTDHLMEEKDLLGAIADVLSSFIQRKRVEERARILLEGVRLAFDSIVMITRDGDIMYANEATQRLFGTTEMPVGRNIAYFFHRKPLVGPTIAEIKEHGTIVEDFTAQKGDGTTFPAEISASCVRDEHGEIIAIIGTIRDMTPFLEAEEAVKKRFEEKIKTGERMRRLVAGILHDLFHSVACLSQMETMAKLGIDLNELRSEFMSAGRLTDELLKHLRLVVSGPRQKTPVDINEILVMETFDAIPMAGARLTLRPAPSGGWLVPGPAFSVSQVFHNLVRNAAEALKGRPKKEITIEAASVNVDEGAFPGKEPAFEGQKVRDGRYMMITVEDTGPGMDSRIIKGILETSDFTPRKGDGFHGIGFQIVRNFIDESGGYLGIESTLDVGTKFTILLPLVPSKT